MQFALTGRHVEITESMRQYAQEKTSRLTRFYDRVERIEAIIQREPTCYSVEVVVHTDHKQTFVGRVDAPDYYEAIDLVVDKLERQLNRHKEKIRNRKHPARPGTRAGEQESSGPAD